MERLVQSCGEKQGVDFWWFTNAYVDTGWAKKWGHYI